MTRTAPRTGFALGMTQAAVHHEALRRRVRVTTSQHALMQTRWSYDEMRAAQRELEQWERRVA